jgi:hypothetical protein
MWQYCVRVQKTTKISKLETGVPVFVAEIQRSRLTAKDYRSLDNKVLQKLSALSSP